MDIIEEIRRSFKPSTSVSVNLTRGEYDRDMDDKIALSAHPKDIIKKGDSFAKHINRKGVSGLKTGAAIGGAAGAGVSGMGIAKAAQNEMTRSGLSKFLKLGPEVSDMVKAGIPLTALAAGGAGLAGANYASKLARQKIKHGHYSHAKK